MVATVVAAMAGTAVEVTGMAVAVGVTAVGVRASMLAVRIITAGMAAVMSVALFRPHGVPAGALSIAATEPEAVHSEKPGLRRAFLRDPAQRNTSGARLSTARFFNIDSIFTNYSPSISNVRNIPWLQRLVRYDQFE